MRVILAALPLISLAFGSAQFSNIEKCLTEFGSASHKHVSTASSTTTVTGADVNVAITVQSTHVVTPLKKTKTVTYTASSSHSSAASGSTITVTATDKIKNFTTIYDVATVSHTNTIVKTIPTPDGFLPIANTTSTYPAVHKNATATLSYSSVHASLKASASAQVSVSGSVSARSAKDAEAHLDGKNFASIVSCIKSIIIQHTNTHTHTAKPTTVTMPASTTTVTVTISSSAISSAVSAAASSASSMVSAAASSVSSEVSAAASSASSAVSSATSAVSASGSVSASADASASATLDARGLFNHKSVVTQTVTTSIYIPATVTDYPSTVTAQVSTTVTSYAACATSNQLGPYLVNGNAIIGVSSVELGASKFPSKIVNAESATECCEICMELGDCTASGFMAESKDFGFCYIYTSNSCAAQSDHQMTYTSKAGVVSRLAMTIGNGACGYIEKK